MTRTCWNKGLTKETSAKVAQGCAKGGATKKLKGIGKGENNPMYGVHRFGKAAPHYGHKHSEATKALMAERARNRKKHYGRKHPEMALRNKLSKGKTYEEIYGDRAKTIKQKIGAAQEGERSHFWKGGLLDDIAEITKLVPPREEDVYSEAESDRMIDLHKQMQVALEIILQTQSFKLGWYKRADTYTSWVKE